MHPDARVIRSVAARRVCGSIAIMLSKLFQPLPEKPLKGGFHQRNARYRAKILAAHHEKRRAPAATARSGVDHLLDWCDGKLSSVQLRKKMYPPPRKITKTDQSDKHLHENNHMPVRFCRHGCMHVYKFESNRARKRNTQTCLTCMITATTC